MWRLSLSLWFFIMEKNRIFILKSGEFNCVDYFTFGNAGNTFLLKARNH